MRQFLLLTLAVAACDSSSDAPATKVVASQAINAGTVLEVKGSVTVAGKPLAKGDTVASDAMIDTGADGFVTIELAHNSVRLELGPNKHLRVDQSLAWKAPKATGVGEGGEGATTSAGRPAERMAAGTSITADEEGASDRGAERERAAGDLAPAEPASGAPPKPVASASPKPPRAGGETAKRREYAPGGGAADAKDSLGTGGLGLKGTGKGGGGTGEGTIGIGSIGSVGRGGGSGPGDGYGAGSGRLGGGSGSKANVTQGAPTVSGGLAAEVIKRVVRRNVNQVRYCYEKALVNNPGLAGKVTVKFVIDREGKVVSATAADNTVGDATVASCITNRFMSWTFPKPADGIVTVTYPFTFAAGN